MYPQNATPGPWIPGIARVNGVTHVSVNKAIDMKKTVALTGLTGQPDEPESIANALLISAAPDMLEALETGLLELRSQLRRLLEHTLDDQGIPESEWDAVIIARLNENKAIKKMEAVIASARGDDR